MARWARGEAEIEQLLRRSELETVTGAAADGAPLLAQARRTAATAAGARSAWTSHDGWSTSKTPVRVTVVGETYSDHGWSRASAERAGGSDARI
jgi:hypothetical protein